MPVLKYHTGSGTYVDLPGSIEEVTVSPTEPPVKTDLWIDTDDDTGYIPSQRLGSRNVIRNGDMSIAQRGNGPFSVVAGYTLDNWSMDYSGTMSVTRAELASDTSMSVLNAAVSGQSGAGNYALLRPFVEDVRTLSGRMVTLSFIAYAASGTPTVGIQTVHYFGSGGSPTVNGPFNTVVLSTTPTRYSATFLMPSVTGKTLGTAHRWSILFWLSAGSSQGIPAPGLQNNTFSITDVQLEEGSVATPFERLPQEQQLAWCQRYFWRVSGPNFSRPNGKVYLPTGLVTLTTNAIFPVTFPTSMRVIPTMTATPLANFACLVDNNSVACTNIYASLGSSGVYLLGAQTASGLTVGRAVILAETADSAASAIDFTAEL